MSKSYSSKISDERDEYPEVTQEDINRAVFRVGLKPTTYRKQKVTIQLDTVLVAYFKAIGGESEYDKLINDTLRRALEYDNLEDTIRRVIREELNHTST